MSYAGTANVARIFPTLTFGTASAITTSDLTTICNERSQWIDDQIGKFYETPVGTAATGTTTLAIINKYVAASDVLNRLTAIGQSDKNPLADDFFSMGRLMIEDIMEERMIITGGTRVTTYDKAVLITGTLDSEGDEREAVFSIEDKF